MRPRRAADLATSRRSIPIRRHRTSTTSELPRYSEPQIGIDGKGRVWLTYRQKFGTRYSTHPGSYWLTFARRLDGDNWTEPIEVHHSDGLLDQRPVLLPHPAGGLHDHPQRRRPLHHAGDDRTTSIYMQLPRPARRAGRAEAGAARARQEGPEASWPRRNGDAVEAHAATIASRPAARSISCCAASSTATPRSPGTAAPTARSRTCSATPSTPPTLDWIGNGDHDNGAGREYSWWLTQKYRPTPTTSRIASRRCSPTSAASPTRTATATASSPSAAFARCRGWLRPTRRSASPASTPTTPRCSTATCTSWTASAPATPAPPAWAPTGATTTRRSSRSSRSTRATACPTRWRRRRGRLRSEGRTRSRRTSPAGIPNGFINLALQEGLPPRLPVVERPLVHAHLLLRCPGRAPRPRGDPRRRCRNATATPPPTTSSSTCSSGDARHGRRVQDRRRADAGYQGHRHRRRWRRSRSCATARSCRRSSRARRSSRRSGPTRSRSGHPLLLRARAAGDGELAWGSPMWIEYAK